MQSGEDSSRPAWAAVWNPCVNHAEPCLMPLRNNSQDSRQIYLFSLLLTSASVVLVGNLGNDWTRSEQPYDFPFPSYTISMTEILIPVVSLFG